MVVKNPYDIRAIAKYLAAVLALFVAISGINGYLFTLIQPRLDNGDNGFSTDAERKKSTEDLRQEMRDLSVADIKKNTEAIKDLAKIIKVIQITQLTTQISDTRTTIRNMEDDRANWKIYERDLYQEKISALDDLTKWRDQLLIIQ